MPYFDVPSRSSKQLLPGLVYRPFWGQNMLISLVDLEPNTVIPAHSHPHEQGTYILEGELEMNLDGERRTLRPGDLVIIPGGVDHSVIVAANPVKLLDIFSPVREDLKF